ncbi:DUF4290 domain-containing protein [Myroides pelagicus]|uniref:DUF4290 domain-containing protein n=1 Tax=Myroides pelagicus TaxID=270914 RepID=A0A7K1GND0_9FLAO|nr:DUF4290 domain-containing protein [Myroides pelagicus]MEC4115130.1 DUF4290 domain-containing protein [Myroides pelagicus]MTH29893.1 DUF4290 domain-containing protein [Myroides pelagicus]
MKFNTKDAIGQLGYNTNREHLIIPEYGRHIQILIDQICLIEDREERNKAAQYAISVMGSMNPHLRDVPDFQHKLWDQLFMMSKFQLDVDCPFPIATKDTIYLKPGKLNYPQNHPKYRFYGNNITYMINEALKFEDGDMKDALIMVIANHMKKSFLSWNKDTVKDDVIFEHLYELSKGKINLFKKEEELSTTANLMQVNKKQSNKTNHSNTQKNNNNKKYNKNNNHQFKSKK